MNTKNTPKITANNSNSEKPKVKTFSKLEKKFKTKQELQAYFVDCLSKNKRTSFNMNVKLT
jgi:hypothetical protein